MDALFDKSTVLGFLAWLTITAQLQLQARRARRLERVVKVLEDGHAGDVVAHRELGKRLAEVTR